LPIDFVRSSGPALPFRSGVLGGILHAHALGRIADLDQHFKEVARVLAPRARYVATARTPGTLLPTFRLVGGRLVGERELRDRTSAAGLIRFERIQIDRTLVFKVEKP